MSNLWKRTLLFPFLVLILFAAILSIIWFASRTLAPRETFAGLSTNEITQRAIAVAQNDYVGTPSKIEVRQSTLGETQIFECSPFGAWISVLTDSLRDRPNWCAPDTGIWIVTLHGSFRQREGDTDTLEIVLDSSGRFMRLGSGELTPKNW